MDYDQILEMVKRVREELKGKQHKIDKNKNGKIDAQDFGHLRKMKEEPEIEEAMSHAAKTTMKHIKNPTAGEKEASKRMKSGVAGYRDRIAMLHSAKNRDALKNEEVEEAVSEASENKTEVLRRALRNAAASNAAPVKPIRSALDKYRARIDARQNHSAQRNEDITLDDYSLEEVEEVEEGWEDMLKAAKARRDAPEQKTKTSTYHDVKKTSTGTVYTKQSDAEGMSKGTGEDAAKAAEPKEKRGRGRPVGSKSGARQAGSSSKTDYRGFVDHTLNLPARK